jgi:hypothetical protein
MSTDAALPLLRRTPLLPGESLPSLVERLTQLNYYADTSTLTQLCQAQQASPWRQDKVGCPLYGATFLRLACLTQLPVAELIAASAHFFTLALAPTDAVPSTADWLAAPNQPRPLPGQARRYLRPTAAAQYCPQCLQQARYQRRSWLPAPVTVCPEHYCLLVDHCPGCQRPIAVADIVRGRCPTCRADLCAAPVVSVAADNLGLQAQNLILAWFGLGPVPPWDTMQHCPAPTSAFRFRLMEHLCRRLLNCQKAWVTWPTPLPGFNEEASHLSAHAYRLTARDTYYLYRAAFAALLDWPQGFYRYLDAYSGWSQADALTTRCTKRLHTLQKDWLAPAWRVDDNDLCLQTFVDYLLDRRLLFSGALVNQLKDITWFVDKTGLWTEARVAQALGVPQQTLGRFYPYGLLADCYCHLDRAGAPYFDRAKVMAVCERWQVAQGWSLAGASGWLGLPESTVLLLVARGLLTPMAGSAEPPHCTFDRQTVIDFFDRVAACAVYSEEYVSGLLPLDDAVRYISQYAVDPATLIHAALNGILSLYKRHPELSALSHVRFVETELLSHGNTLPAPLGWVSALLFTRSNNLEPGTIRKWVNAGLIQPKGGTDDYFEIQRLEELTAAQRTAL